MKTRLVLLFALMSTMSLFAQTVWKGGFPGQENNWFCQRNWSGNQVPGDLDDVIIPDRSTQGSFYPVVSQDKVQVQSLAIQPGARLTIRKGATLSVRGFDLPGGALFNQGALENNGTLEVIEPVMHAVNYTGQGSLIHTRSALAPDICQFECSLH